MNITSITGYTPARQAQKVNFGTVYTKKDIPTLQSKLDSMYKGEERMNPYRSRMLDLLDSLRPDTRNKVMNEIREDQQKAYNRLTELENLIARIEKEGVVYVEDKKLS